MSVDTQITFVKDDQGRATDLILHRNDWDLEVPKIKQPCGVLKQSCAEIRESLFLPRRCRGVRANQWLDLSALPRRKQSLSHWVKPLAGP